jgi:predicted nuclease with TOPRIM domain
MSIAIKTLEGMGVKHDDAVKLAEEMWGILAEAAAERNELSREIEVLMARYDALNAQVSLLETALAAEQENVVPLHGVSK